MAEATAAKSDEGGNKPAEGLSHFLAKVLDQLSLSSWLPAVVFVASLTVMGKLHEQENLDFASALRAVSDSRPVGLLVVVLFAIVFTAVITQAFAFELIRLWEGYWGASWLVLPLLRTRIRRHRRRIATARKRLEVRRAAALSTALTRLEEAGYSRIQIELVKWAAEGGESAERPAGSLGDRRKARRVLWRDYASPALLASEDRYRARLENYPADSRILPTRLGNTLRAREDRIKDRGRSLEGVVMRRYETVPARLLARHDQFRDRVEMYCVLVSVFTVLAAASVPLLAPCTKGFLASWIGLGAFVLLGSISYAAAVSSAGGYGAVLAQIAELPAEPAPGWRSASSAKIGAWWSRAS